MRFDEPTKKIYKKLTGNWEIPGKGFFLRPISDFGDVIQLLLSGTLFWRLFRMN